VRRHGDTYQAQHAGGMLTVNPMGSERDGETEHVKRSNVPGKGRKGSHMKRLWISLVAAGLLAMAAFAPAAAQNGQLLQLEPVDDSGVSGTVRITSDNGQVTVAILLTEGLEEDAVHPVHIHDGTCDDLGGVAYPLEDIVDGVSETTLEVDLAEIMTGEYAINVHLSADEMSVWVACADIPVVMDEVDEDVEEEVDDDAVADDDEADDEEVDEVVPAAGYTGGMDTNTAVMMLVLLGGAMLGAGVIVRRFRGRVTP
jgi:hypothetical protein